MNSFALTVIGSRYILLTGGRASFESLSDQVCILDLDTGKWSSNLPTLSTARCNHGSVATQSKAFVFCGTGANNKPLNSAEYLELSDKREWVPFELPGLKPRTCLVAALINPSVVLLVGGLYIATCLSDGAYFDTETLEIIYIRETNQLQFQCWNN